MKIKSLDHQLVITGFVLLIPLFLSACQRDRQNHAYDYKELLSTVHAQGQLNGNVLILENGNITHQGAYGIGNIDPMDSLNLHSVFRLGSVSKQFTAMGIMNLKESGALTYDQDIRDFIPELPYEGITIRHLLNHVSGLPDYTILLDEHWKAELKYDDPERFISGNKDIIEMLAKHKPDIHFNPGDKWEYSNTGYVVLASVISLASGMPFEQYLKESIFDPAKMTNTIVYNYVPGPYEQMPFRVYGFRTGINGIDVISNDCHFLNPAQGDGGIYSTLADLLKWDRILYTEELISEATRNEAFTPAILNSGDTTDYGFGWRIDNSPSGKKVVQHGGAWVGFRTFIYREIEENNCIIILTNNTGQYFMSILDQLKNILHDLPYDIPRMAIGETIGRIALNQGIDAAIEEYRKLKSETPDKYEFQENQLNYLGYQLMQLDQIEDAIKIFQLNMEEYPNSANTHDSLGDAFLAHGDTISALSSFKKALSIDSTFTSSSEKIDLITK